MSKRQTKKQELASRRNWAKFVTLSCESQMYAIARDFPEADTSLVLYELRMLRQRVDNIWKQQKSKLEEPK